MLDDAPQYSPAGHYYSPIASLSEVRARASQIWPDPPPATLPGINLNEMGQLGLLHELARFYPEQPFADQPHDGLRYGFANDFFCNGDALYLYGMLRYVRPKRLIEVGSGYSSAVTLDTNERFLGHSVSCTFIEPEPVRLDALLSDTDRAQVEIIEEHVQDVSVDRFTSLEPGDILFIDGSHITKVGSDVNYMYFEVLPRLEAGVYVHIHDICYPFEYPRYWVEQGRGWNEAYLVRALLQNSHGFEIALFAHYLALFHAEELRELMPLVLQNVGASLWLRRTI